MTEEEEREAKRAYMRDYMRARRAKERANSGVESPTPRTPRYTQAASISQDTEDIEGSKWELPVALGLLGAIFGGIWLLPKLFH